MLTADRQRYHLLQHSTPLTCIRAEGTAGDLEAIDILKSTSPVAWRNINLIGNFDFTEVSSVVDIEALAAHYQNQDFWKRSLTESNEDDPR